MGIATELFYLLIIVASSLPSTKGNSEINFRQCRISCSGPLLHGQLAVPWWLVRLVTRASRRSPLDGPTGAGRTVRPVTDDRLCTGDRNHGDGLSIWFAADAGPARCRRSAFNSLGSWSGPGFVAADQAASSIARIAVSGWLIGSTPTRLTIEVTVPSASASTHAARCSSPRCGNPGSSTHPDAAPAHSGSDETVSAGGCSIIRAGGVWSAKYPGERAVSPTTGPSASTRPTVPGTGSSGRSSRTPKIVVVDSNPGSDATLTATMSSCAHSLVESGHRPETTKPLSAPCEWKGATSMARPDPELISAASALEDISNQAVTRRWVDEVRMTEYSAGTQHDTSANRA